MFEMVLMGIHTSSNCIVAVYLRLMRDRKEVASAHFTLLVATNEKNNSSIHS